jgi:hypothetical protein
MEAGNPEVLMFIFINKIFRMCECACFNLNRNLILGVFLYNMARFCTIIFVFGWCCLLRLEH